jgi:hypothetical protein
LQAAALNLGEVEHIVEQREQRAAVETHGLEVAELIGVEIGFRQHFGHPQDRVHRRAKLVRHG